MSKSMWLAAHLAALGGMGYAWHLRDLGAFLICFVMFCQMPRFGLNGSGESHA